MVEDFWVARGLGILLVVLFCFVWVGLVWGDGDDSSIRDSRWKFSILYEHPGGLLCV